MTGTSLDGLDAALIRLEGRGLRLRLTELVRTADRPLGTLAGPLRALADQQPCSAGEVARVSHQFGQLHADLLEELTAGQRLDLIAVHGQTVFHAPPLSTQLINPHPIVHRLPTPLVFDLRQSDLAAGGQGAPITPLADFILFRDPTRTRAVLNLGGFANVTHLPDVPDPATPGSASPGTAGSASAGASTAEPCDASVRSQHELDAALDRITGGDLCACNQLLDRVAREAMNTRYDEAGQHAARGRTDESALQSATKMLEAQAAGGRSLGTGDEAGAWVAQHLHRCSGNDLAHTACTALGRVIGGRLGRADQLVIAGGGARNTTLVEQIAQHTEAEIITADALGVPSQSREAIAMAVLGALAADGVPITLPRITGRSAHVARSGCWVYP